MSEYLVTDLLTGRETWTLGASAAAACRRHENTLRYAATEYPRQGLPALPVLARASHYDAGPVIDVTIGDSAVLGLRCFVVR